VSFSLACVERLAGESQWIVEVGLNAGNRERGSQKNQGDWKEIEVGIAPLPLFLYNLKPLTPRDAKHGEGPE